MNPWFRFYTEVLNDPKVQNLPSDAFRFWISTLCLASTYDGYLPDLRSVSFAFRIPEEETQKVLHELWVHGLLDKRKDRYTPHNWFKRQYKSDVSTNRVKQFRERKRNVSESLHETAPEQIQNRAETDTEQNRRERERKLAFGEHGHALLTPSEHTKLKEKMNGLTDDFIQQFDNWVHEAPDARHAGVRRKERNPYASICQWYDRAKKEGKLKPPKLSDEEREKRGFEELRKIRGH